MGGDIVVLGIAGSATQVTSYSLTRFIPLTITAAVASVIFGMAPGLGGLIGAGEMVRAARVRSETMAVAWLMATVAGAGVLLWEESFLRLWVGQRDTTRRAADPAHRADGRCSSPSSGSIRTSSTSR